MSSSNDSVELQTPNIERVRLEPVRRNLTVKHVRRLNTRMISITLGGEELAGFHSPSPDDHVKVFFPASDGSTQGRDYTPRHFDAASGLLTLEFFLHEGGIGSAWAQEAKLGDPLQIGGPRGSMVISAPGAWWLLIGDETALPSVARRLEEMAADTKVITLLAVTAPSEELPFKTHANLTMHWLHRPETQSADTTPFVSSLAKLQLPEGPGFTWIAAEDQVSRAVRSYLLEARGFSPEWVKASAYWSMKLQETS